MARVKASGTGRVRTSAVISTAIRRGPSWWFFPDGNHHMALEEWVASFPADKPDVGDVLYATTPPARLVQALENGVLHVGNLALSVAPNVFIGRSR